MVFVLERERQWEDSTQLIIQEDIFAALVFMVMFHFLLASLQKTSQSSTERGDRVVNTIRATHCSEGEVGEKCQKNWVGTFPERNYNLQWLVQVPEVLSRRTAG